TSKSRECLRERARTAVVGPAAQSAGSALSRLSPPRPARWLRTNDRGLRFSPPRRHREEPVAEWSGQKARAHLGRPTRTWSGSAKTGYRAATPVQLVPAARRLSLPGWLGLASHGVPAGSTTGARRKSGSECAGTTLPAARLAPPRTAERSSRTGAGSYPALLWDLGRKEIPNAANRAD